MLLILAAILSGTIEGRVVGVVDGDTISVLVANPVSSDSNPVSSSPKPVKVRLVEIDAPEQKQAFGQRSKQALSGKIFGKVVEVRITGQDRYSRDLGTVFLGDENVNHWLVSEGWAWQYDRYSKSEELLRLQVEARAARRGLWADKDPIEPWLWRRK